MAFLDIFQPKDKRLADVLENKKDGKPSTLPVTMPETIDFSALWTEPDAGGGLMAMVPLITLALVAILFIMKLFGH